MKKRIAFAALAGLACCAALHAAQNAVMVDDLHPGIVINKDNRSEERRVGKEC